MLVCGGGGGGGTAGIFIPHNALAGASFEFEACRMEWTPLARLLARVLIDLDPLRSATASGYEFGKAAQTPDSRWW